MKSLVISQKAFACEIFLAFSSEIQINGQWIQGGISGDEFIWHLHPMGYFERNNCLMDPNARSISYRMRRDEAAFRSSEASDMINFLTSELEKFNKTWYLPNPDKYSPLDGPTTEGHVLGQVYYPATEFPRRDESTFYKDSGESYSVDVLIDLTGEKKFYTIGWYDFDDNQWCTQEHIEDGYSSNGVKNEEKMLWRYIDYV